MFSTSSSPALKSLKKRLHKKWRFEVLCLALAFFVANGITQSWNTSTGHLFDRKVLRQFFMWAGPRPPPPDVVIVSIDDESYQKFEESSNFPLPRRYIAEALEHIVQAKPGAIILDARIPPERKTDPAADDRIEAALRAGPTTIWSGKLPDDPTDPSTKIVLASDERFRSAAKMELSMAVGGGEDGLCYMADSREPIATLYERTPVARALVELAHLQIAEPGPNDFINFYGPKLTINRISLHELIGNDVNAAMQKLTGKIVLMGYQSLQYGKGTTHKDEFPISASEHQMFGIEVHANIIGNLMDGSWLKRPSMQDEQTLVFLVIFLLGAVAIRLKPLPGLLLIGTTCVGLTSVAYYFFVVHQRWVSGIAMLLIASAIIMALNLLCNLGRVEAIRKYVNQTFRFKLEE